MSKLITPNNEASDYVWIFMRLRILLPRYSIALGIYVMYNSKFWYELNELTCDELIEIVSLRSDFYQFIYTLIKTIICVYFELAIG